MASEAKPEAVLLNFVAPHANACFRWPFNGGTPETELTGTASLHNIFTINAPGGFVGTYTGGVTTSWIAYLFRQPLRNLVTLQRTASTFTYNAVFTSMAGSPTAPSNTTTWVNPIVSDTAWFPIAYMSTTQSGAPHGPAITNGATSTSYLYMGSIESSPGANFIWMGLGDSITFTSSTGTGTDTLYATYLINPGSTVPEVMQPWEAGVSSATNTTLTINGTALLPGYYAFSVLGSASPWTYAVKLVVAAGDVLAHQSLPFAASHPTWMQSVRVNATSLLISNIASAIYREGPVYGALITDESDFRSYTTTTSLTTRSRYRSGSNSKGLYGWLPPVGARAMERRPAIETSGPVFVATNFYLDDGTAYEVFRVDCTSQQGSVAPALDFIATLQTSVEYTTTDQWAELEFSTVDAVNALRCLQTAARCEVFAENPLHLHDITSFVGKAASWIRAHSGVMGRALSAAFPAYSAPISAIAGAFQS